MNNSRQIVLDTETTGLSPKTGHKIIEIGCIELISRKKTNNKFHVYIDPQRAIDPGASKVHGITNKDLKGKPVFLNIVNEFIEFIKGAELIIHNAPFDVGFIESELSKCKHINTTLQDICTITDTLVMARQLHPGQKNNLDALCRRYQVNNTSRQLHGALLDAEILAEVYLNMTGGQINLNLNQQKEKSAGTVQVKSIKVTEDLKIIYADEKESKAHTAYIEKLES